MEVVEEGLRGCDGECGGLADVLVVDENGAGFGAEALTAAVGAEGVAAVLGEEDADVEFVFFALECAEESLNAGVGAVAFFDEALLVVGQIVPGDVGWDVGGFGGADHLAVMRAVLRGAPGGDGTVGERF